MSQKLLLNKIAIITGGARGIGSAIANTFFEEGASIALFGTNSEKGREAVERYQSLAQEGQKAIFYAVDVSQGKPVEEALQRVYQDFGRVDILVNNAGITRDNLLMRLTEEDWDQVLDTNLKSIYHTCRGVIRQMLKAKEGKIINISSVVGLIGNPGQTNYAASKAGMIGFTKALAKEVGGRGICVNCIAPGFIQTDMTDGLTEKQKEAIFSQVPMGRLGQAEEVAYAALFLASRLSNYITGHILTVDGGMTM